MPQFTSYSGEHHYRVSEKAIERHFVNVLRSCGISAVKQFNPYEAGWPDRLVVLPDQRVIWVEFKSKGKRPTALQVRCHNMLKEVGHDIRVVDNRDEADELAQEIVDIYLKAARNR